MFYHGIKSNDARLILILLWLIIKDKELVELKAMLSDGDGLSCPRCQRLTGSPSSEDDAFTQQKIKLDILEQKLQESESKLETTVVVRKCWGFFSFGIFPGVVCYSTFNIWSKAIVFSQALSFQISSFFIKFEEK